MLPALKKVALLFVFITLLGCSYGGDKPVARIKFCSPKDSYGVKSVEGLSACSAKGRWSDADIAPGVTIHFENALPQKISILIKGLSIKSSERVTVLAGSLRKEVMLKKDMGYAEVFLDLNEPVKKIELIPESPVSPKQLGINGDTRKLGMFLSEVSIYKAD